jgi:cytochrome c553
MKQFLGFVMLAPLAADPAFAAAAKSFDTAVKPLLKTYCVACHNARLQSGNLNFEALGNLENRDVWEKAVARLRAGAMPPKGAKQPPAAQVAAVASFIEGEYARLDRAEGPNPGRVTARRLNRYEYNATVRDLLGVDFKPAADFPADDSGYGFDNIGDVLSLSPVLMEKYLKAAEKIARAVIVAGETAAGEAKPTVDRYSAERTNQTERLHIGIYHDFPADAEYHLRAGWGNRVPLGLEMKGKLLIDGETVLDTPTRFEETRPRAFEGRFAVKAGPHRIEADLDVGNYDGKVMPWLEFIEIRGPFNARPPSPGEPHRRIMVCGHAFGEHRPECARKVAAPLARRAFRRPVTDRETEGLARFITLAQERGDSFEQGVRVALAAVLVSPHFLFRIERDPVGGKGPHRISEHELASRLSYFLWSSLPDEELLAAADAGRLRLPGALEAQVRRMLADPRSRALTENFAGQWLEIRNLETLKPDAAKFPEFDGELGAAMRRETELFFENLIREDGSVLDFIDGRYTFVNERLAKHYGLAGVKGREFRKVPLDGVERSGVLTQASVLTVSSYPTRTSPVIRGKWILENILDAPPPPPPPDVPNLDEKAAGATGTLRQQLDKHRSNAMCAACHANMDALGFGLENYDAIGRWRTHEGSFPLDVTGVLPGGRSFQTPQELKSVLKDRREEFVRCLTGKLLTYGLGRGLERYDRAAVDLIAGNAARGGYRFSRLVLGVVESLPFQMRKGT